MTRRLPVFLVRGLALLLWLSALPAWAYPSQVADILRQKGQAGAVQPSSLAANVKAQLDTLAKDTAQRTGAKVYLVVMKESDDPNDFAAMYGDLGMSGKDLLISTNGPKWDLRSNALTSADKQALLNRVMSQGGPPLDRMRSLTSEVATALTHTKNVIGQNAVGKMSWNEFQHANTGRGWSPNQMSAAYARYKSGQPYENTASGRGNDGAMTTTSTQVPQAVPPAQSSGGNGFLIFLMVAALGIGGWVFWRRKQRDTGLGEELKKALAGPEATMADVWMGLDESHPNYTALVDQASVVDNSLKEIKGQAPTRENIARVRSLSERAQQLRIAVDRK